MWMLLVMSAWALDPALTDSVALGDCDRVRSLIPSPGTDEERLVVGLCDRKTDPARADQLLQPLQAGVLGEYGRLAHAEVLLELDRPAEAIGRLDGLSLSGAPGLRVRLIRDRALIADHRSLDARADLQALLSTSAADEARWWLGFGAEDRGELDAAQAAWRRVWADNTRGGWSEAAASALERTGAPVPDLATEAGRALVLERINALREAQRHVEATDLLLRWREAAGVTSVDAALGRAYFQARRYPDAVAVWQSIYGPPESASGPPAALFDLALAASRTGDHDRARGWYQRLMAIAPTSEEADHASYKLGFLEFDRGRCDDAIARFSEHLRRYPASADLESARWFSGWCAWKLGRHDEAIGHWDALLRDRPSTSLTSGVAYWKARLLGLRGDADAERVALLSVVQRYPISGHAWLAADRVGMVFPARAAATAPPLPASLTALSSVRRADTLLKAGLRTWAAGEARGAISTAKAQGQSSATALAWMLIGADAFAEGRALVQPWCTSPRADASAQLLQACWPRAEGGIVASAAARYGLDNLLPYAIMQAESAYDPGVTSAAGARGLMQIMPAEGDRLHAEAVGHGLFLADNLYLAPYNALLGTTELGLKAQSLAGTLQPSSLPAVIASYNAGEDAVRRWQATGISEADVFAEDIPFTETRRYVRTVLGNLMAWRWVHGQAP